MNQFRIGAAEVAFGSPPEEEKKEEEKVTEDTTKLLEEFDKEMLGRLHLFQEIVPTAPVEFLASKCESDLWWANLIDMRKKTRRLRKMMRNNK